MRTRFAPRFTSDNAVRGFSYAREERIARSVMSHSEKTAVMH
ncbi:hypothetical protein MBEHAL_2508 [Halarchaeum acidiphilum MH1-52-1]|uniref:Uncharacterized protein n=1 Tax=Halarchaeum acidiphilum MH1-52-1 TaxID=1261545 RepID=U3AG26_9EURY|nr:hypothetical protein MBEHAL_2508 [Halarchaeum acidiphilum MH1-52-1]